MSPVGIEYLGWAATAVFVASYFFARPDRRQLELPVTLPHLTRRRPSLLRAVQMFGALLRVTYGVLIKASPVIFANVLVFSAAAWTTYGKTSTP